MKTSFIIVIFILIIFKSWAQIIITRPDFPLINDHTRTINCDDTSVYEGVSGANILWDFSTLDTTTVYLPYSYTYLLPTFINCTNENLDNNWNPFGSGGEHFSYYTDNNNYNLVYDHSWYFSSYSYQVCFSNQWTQMKFPFSFNDTIIDVFNFNSSYWDGGTGQYYSTGFGYDTTICDSWGTIILPFGTFNALRTISLVEYVDTNFSYLSANSHYVLTKYNWYTNLHKCPLLSIQYRTNLITGFVNKFVQICPDSYNTVSIDNPIKSQEIISLARSTPINVYKINFFNSAFKNYSISIFDICGKEIVSFEKSVFGDRDEVIINLNSESNGIYVVIIKGINSFCKHFKIIKQ